MQRGLPSPKMSPSWEIICAGEASFQYNINSAYQLRHHPALLVVNLRVRISRNRDAKKTKKNTIVRRKRDQWRPPWATPSWCGRQMRGQFSRPWKHPCQFLESIRMRLLTHNRWTCRGVGFLKRIDVPWMFLYLNSTRAPVYTHPVETRDIPIHFGDNEELPLTNLETWGEQKVAMR